MTLELFEKKHKDLFDLGVCSIHEFDNSTFIKIDRYFNGKFLCDYSELKRPQDDARKMGFTRSNVGIYVKFHF